MLGHPCLLVSITSPYTLVIACFRSSCTCVPTHAPAPQTQRLKAYLKTIEDNSRQRHTSFANFRRRLEASSGADAGWKQLLEQEILHLQEHVESVNRDLVSCAMALRESLSTHDDANNLIVLLNLSRDRRRETRNNIILYFKQQQVCLPATSVHLSSYAHARTRTALRACHVRQEKLKSSGASVSSKVDELVNFIMDHYSVLQFSSHIFSGDNTKWCLGGSACLLVSIISQMQSRLVHTHFVRAVRIKWRPWSKATTPYRGSWHKSLCHDKKGRGCAMITGERRRMSSLASLTD